MELIKYTTTTMIFRPGEQVDIGSNCNAVIFINAGAASLTIDNIPIPAGGSFTIPGNLGEINTKNSYKVNFSSNAATELLVVVKKNYV